MTIDIKEFALKEMETAKNDLRRNGYLIPVAFIVTDTEVFDYTLDFGSAEEKASVYAALVDDAIHKDARAIITINDANVTSDSEISSQSAINGAANLKRVQECMFLAVSGPAIQTWTTCLPYDRTSDGIVFGMPSETTNDFLNLLRGWPKDQRSVS
jgi:hypothetical protein